MAKASHNELIDNFVAHYCSTLSKEQQHFIRSHLADVLAAPQGGPQTERRNVYLQRLQHSSDAVKRYFAGMLAVEYLFNERKAAARGEN